MKTFVIDASVAVKWYLKEDYSEAAYKFLSNDFQLIEPSFFFLEMYNVLLKRIRRKEITHQIADRIRSTLHQHPFIIHSDRTLLDLTYRVASRVGCSLYDAIYLALAVNLGERMVTADRRLYNGLSTSTFSKNILWVEDLK